MADYDAISETARELGRELCGTLPHVVGTSVRWSDTEPKERQLWVDVDSKDAIPTVPTRYGTYDVHVRLVGTPKFA
jgi:hypothetical protein